MVQTAARTVYVLNGPNLDLVGRGKPDAGDHVTFADVENLCVESASRFGLTAECRQSDHESALIDAIREAGGNGAAGIVVNAGASMALRDALAGARIPVVEVHAGNAVRRDSLRYHSFAANAAFASLCGFGIEGYRLAFSGLAAKIGATA